MNLFKKYLSIILFISAAILSPLNAQSDLEIRKAFEQYGENKGVVMVELSAEMLDGYDFTLFKSLTISNNPDAGNFIRKCLSKDELGAKKVKQVVANGKPTSIFLQLPRKSDIYRLILFNEVQNLENKITLIYIESKTDSEDVLKLILKKK